MVDASRGQNSPIGGLFIVVIARKIDAYFYVSETDMTSTDLPLFPDESLALKPPASIDPLGTVKAPVRVKMPNRRQLELRAVDLESSVAEDHRVRIVWAYVERLDLSALYARIKAVEGGVGRSSIAPEILLSLWLFATLESVGSARALARMTEEHDAYRWICGGVSVNYHTLADFRVGHGDFLDELLTTSVASLMSVDAVSLTRLAQDGMRVRACAGASSFRRKAKLEEFLDQAKKRVAQLKEQIEADPAGPSRRMQAARDRAARDRQEKVEKALSRLPELEAAKERQKARGKKKVSEPRVSTTDAEATVMKMPNGGHNPAYNVQFCTDTASQVIVGVDLLQAGTDHGQLTPMLAQIEKRYRRTPNEYLVDGGYVSAQEIAAAARCKIYAPVPERSRDKLPPHAPRSSDTAPVAEWRARMATDEAKKVYVERASTAECVNALARERSLTKIRVRGIIKAKAAIMFYALAHNLMRLAKLAPDLLSTVKPTYQRVS